MGIEDESLNDGHVLSLFRSTFGRMNALTDTLLDIMSLREVEWKEFYERFCDYRELLIRVEENCKWDILFVRLTQNVYASEKPVLIPNFFSSSREEFESGVKELRPRSIDSEELSEQYSGWLKSVGFNEYDAKRRSEWMVKYYELQGFDRLSSGMSYMAWKRNKRVGEYPFWYNNPGVRSRHARALVLQSIKFKGENLFVMDDSLMQIGLAAGWSRDREALQLHLKQVSLEFSMSPLELDALLFHYHVDILEALRANNSKEKY